MTNLNPYPRIHFYELSYAPLISYDSTIKNSISVFEITNSCFENDNFFVSSNILKGKFMSCCMMYAGDVTPMEINESINLLK